MYCINCGNEVSGEYKYCPKCGAMIEKGSESNEYNNYGSVPVYNVRPQVKQESSALGVLSIVFSCLGGFLGLILSIIGMCTYKEESNKKLCKIGLGICIGWFALGFLIGLGM